MSLKMVNDIKRLRTETEYLASKKKSLSKVDKKSCQKTKKYTKPLKEFIGGKVRLIDK